MTRDAALAYLESWRGEVAEPDREQRAWKLAHAEGALLAYERTGVLSREEVARWRERLLGGGDEPAEMPATAMRAAAERHLEALVARAPRLRREPAPADLAAGMEASTAILALHAAGILDDDAAAGWHSRLLAVQAPWMEDPVAPPPGTLYAVYVPPDTAEQAAADARWEAQLAAQPAARHGGRVVVGSPERHDGLAIVALVAYEDATSVHFHHVGGPMGAAVHGRRSLEAFSAAVEALTPPVVVDDVGTAYAPAGERPSASGAGGMPDPERRQVITGAWTFTPAPPAQARRFTIERAGARWVLEDAAG